MILHLIHFPPASETFFSPLLFWVKLKLHAKINCTTILETEISILTRNQVEKGSMPRSQFVSAAACEHPSVSLIESWYCLTFAKLQRSRAEYFIIFLAFCFREETRDIPAVLFLVVDPIRCSNDKIKTWAVDFAVAFIYSTKVHRSIPWLWIKHLLWFDCCMLRLPFCLLWRQSDIFVKVAWVDVVGNSS